jgi:hypothetical protein
MRHLWLLIPFVAALATIRVWWAELAGIAVLTAVVCGLAGLTYLVVRTRRPMPPLPGEQQRARSDLLQRDIPPPTT